MQTVLSHQRIALMVLTILVTVFAGGCRSLFRPPVVVTEHFPTEQPTELFVSPYFQSTKLQRVVLLVPRCKENNYQLQSKVAESIGRELSERGTFQIVAATIDVNFDLNKLLSGEYSERQIHEYARQHGADGVLVCETSEFSPYEPIGAGVSLTLFDTRELIVTLFASGHWDMSHSGVNSSFTQYVCKKHRCDKFAAGIHLRSPNEFFEFIARELSDHISNRLGTNQYAMPY